MVTFWMLCPLCSLYRLPILSIFFLYDMLSIYTLYMVPMRFAYVLAVLRMGKVSRYRHGQAIVVGLANPASMAFVVVVMYRLTAVASLVMPQCDQEHPCFLKDSLMMFSRLDMIGSIFTLHLPASGWPQARHNSTQSVAFALLKAFRDEGQSWPIIQHHIT